MASDSGMLQRVRRSLHALPVAATGDRASVGTVVAAFSGGADSLALVVLLKELERLGLLRLVAAHVDHQVRPESGDEAAAVAVVAGQLDVAFGWTRIEPEAIARHPGVGLEEAMRRERYRALAAIAAEEGAIAVATGHHRRDQAETVLLHLLRGAGTGGAAGMREVSTLTVPWWSVAEPAMPLTLWRPLLGEDPALLRAMVESRGLPIVEDPSNRSEAFRRNSLRHRVLPLLEAIVPGADGNLASFAARAAEDDDALDAIVEGIIAVLPSAARDRLPRIVLGERPIAIQRRLIRRWVADVAPAVELTADRTEAIRVLAERNEGDKTVQIGGGWSVRLERGDLKAVPPARGDVT